MLIKHSDLMNNKQKIKKPEPKLGMKPKKWLKQSEEFRAVIRNNRAIDQGKPGVYIKSSIPDDYIHCKYCNRRYNENAYNKHLNFCERKFKDAMKNPMNKPNMNLSSKPIGKPSYKPNIGGGMNSKYRK